MPPAKRKTSNKQTQVDDTVKNQEEPFAHTTERPSTEKDATEPEVAKNTPAHEVDDTVKNQENPGAVEPVDRNPGPQVVTDAEGISYDVSKSSPELLQEKDSDEELARKARLKQESAVLDARDQDETRERKFIEVEFVSTGLTAKSKVWKAGEILRFEDTEQSRLATASKEGKLWYDMTAEEQKKRFGRVMFERR